MARRLLLLCVVWAGLLGAPPKRIVSLSPACTELLFALGAGPRVVGVTTYCDYPPEVRTLPKVGGYSNPSTEAILALRPDLLFVQPNVGNEAPVKRAATRGAQLESHVLERLSDLYSVTERMGSVLGAEPRAAELVAQWRAEQARLSAARPARRKRVALVLSLQPLILAGKDTFAADLLDLAGADPFDKGGRYPQLSLEGLLAWRPDMILLCTMDGAPAGAALQEWQRLAGRAGAGFAVKEIQPDVILRPGPRWPQGVERLRGALR